MTQRKRKRRDQLLSIWPRFDAKRTREAHGDLGLLLENLVNVSAPVGSSHFDRLHQFARAADRPFPVKSLSEKLRASVAPRGDTLFGKIGDKIEAIICNYPTLRWWMEVDGLVVDEVQDKLNELSQFDRVAGALLVKHWNAGRLAKQSLVEIAEALDREGFQLKGDLQPADWKQIAHHNQKHGRNAIGSFATAVADARFVRGVRRRLYLARKRYQKALCRTQSLEIGV